MADTADQGGEVKGARVIGRVSLTLLTLGLAAAAVVLGVAVLHDRASAVPAPDAAAAVPVETSIVRFEESYTVPRRFTGQIEARSVADLSFELTGRLDALSVEEGENVVAGQEIAHLDTDLLQAEAARLTSARAATQAQVDFAQLRLVRARQLQEQGFSSLETFDQALAARDELANRLAEVDAALQAVSINLRKSVLHAPFSGQISSQSAERSETVQAGQPILSIVETGNPEVRVGVPLDIQAEDLSGVTVDVGGHRITSHFKRFRPDIDPVTRTRTALLALSDESGLMIGQTASVVLEKTVAARGAWVPLEALQSGTGSVWTIMVVQDQTLRPASVELLHVSGARAYVQGSLSDGDRIVVSGAHRVVAGQTVHVLRSGD